jgi:hypothetical protein
MNTVRGVSKDARLNATGVGVGAWPFRELVAVQETVRAAKSAGASLRM